MPEYLAPGVYIEEIEIGAKPIEGVSTSTAVFLGRTERGPTEPTLITSLTQFHQLFGGPFSFEASQQEVTPYLPYAVEGFFLNGGKRCFVCRTLGDGATQATFTFDHEDGPTFSALSPGSWGNRLLVVARPSEENAENIETFEVYLLPPGTDLSPLLGNSQQKAWFRQEEENLVINFDPVVLKRLLDKARVKEVYPFDASQLKDQLERNSLLIRMEKDLPSDFSPGLYLLGGGSEGELKLENYTSFFETLAKTEEISLVYAPYEEGVYESLIPRLLAHCEGLMDRFLVIDPAPNQKPNDLLQNPPRDRWESKYAAFYYPWLRVYDPLSQGLKEVPPGGHVLGVFARTDTERGVHKAPANEPIRGVVGLAYVVGKGEQETLNPKGINCIRALPARGIRIWGARTLSSDPLWKYVNVRRLFIFLEKSIERGVQWVVFEPNSPRLWARVRQTISQFLTNVWKDGALMGTTPEEAFFVKCDETTMTPNDLENGRLVVLVGVAPVKPAEFVIFRIAQWSGGSEVTE